VNPRHKREARTVQDLQRDGSAPKGSLLEHIAPVGSGGKPQRRRLTMPQEQLYDEIVNAPDEVFGERQARKENGRKIRMGANLDARVEEFLTENRAITQSRLFEFAVHRLLTELGY
jgi:hypothetical protein